MPLASMLEMDKPLVFTASHSNGTSTELASHPTVNKATLSRPVHNSTLNHTKLSSSFKDSSHYYSSSIPSGYENTQQILVGSPYQEQQPKIPNSYHYSATTKPGLPSYPSSSSSSSSSSGSTLTTQLPSPSTSITNISPTTITPPLLSSSFSFTSNSPLPTPQLQDSTYSYGSPYRQELPPIDHHVKIVDAGLSPLHSKIIPPTTDSMTPLKRIFGQDEEVDPGFCDNNAARKMKRRKELNQRIDTLNSDFNQYKEKIFAEKLLVIQNEVGQIHNNTHYKYKDGLILLESKRLKTINDGRLLCDYQTKISDHQFTLEIHHAEEDYKAERQQVREKLYAVLEEKRSKLKQDKNNCDLTFDVVLESQTRMNKRLRRRGMDHGDTKANKRKQASVFKLKDDEVYDDLQAMRCVKKK